MTALPDDQPEADNSQLSRAEERNLFLFITILLFPILSVVLVGGYGFLIWIMQIIFGPPSG